MVLLLGFLVPTLTLGATTENVKGKRTESFESFSIPSDTLTPGIFQQDIDHSGKLPGQKFNQRYWIDSEFAASSPNAPVLLHICGEGDAEKGYFLHDNALAWAKTLGAHIVYLEHRDYGQSLVFPDLSNDHIQYLTLDNVLDDLATFQKWISLDRGLKGKWISIGGSYSGTISALYRQKYPKLVVGALAASAPMISGVGISEGTAEDASDISNIDPSDDSGDRQWAFQSCTTFGFWITDETSLYEPSQWLCNQAFGNAPFFNSTTYNKNYYSPFISNSPAAPSNILFTYGSADIWTTIGLDPKNNANSKISILTINGAGHHFDLNDPTPSDSDAVKSARAQFVVLAKKWLGNL